MTDKQTTQQIGLDIDIQDLVLVVTGMEIAINKKAYSYEEIQKYFPAWNNITASLEKYKRQATVVNLYNKTEDEVNEKNEKIIKIND